jgi:hypothetical protein
MDMTFLFVLLRHWLPLLGLLLIFSQSQRSSAQSFEQPPVQVYLPLMRELGPGLTPFGLEVDQVVPERDVERLIDLGPSWVRRNALSWAAVEPVEGAGYAWDHPSIVQLEQDLLALNRVGTRVVLIVHRSPDWAITPYQADCAPINPAKYQAFAAFLRAAVERYSQPPFNVQYWEIVNEPDAPISPNDAVYGCWGVADDPYYGGRAYGEMLNVVYPEMKRAAPSIQVLFGGLLLDRPFSAEDGSGRSSLFLEGALLVGAGASFDILSFHSYTFYNGTPDGNQPQSWKVAYLREVLARFELDKQLFQTEGALLCVERSSECHLAQAHGVPRLYVRAMRDGLLGYIWYLYNSDSFRHTALIEPASLTEVRPAYTALRTLRYTLQGASYNGIFPALPTDAEGYVLVRGTEAIGVVWSNTPQLLQMPFTAPLLGCHDWQGTAVACMVQEGVLTVELQPGPLYIRWLNG